VNVAGRAVRDFGVALVLQDQSWMPTAGELSRKFNPITAGWTYIRWLGDRKGIEKVTRTWNRTVIDRTHEMTGWVDVCYETVRRGVTVFGYANNHYAGHAPATIRQFRDAWSAKNLPALWQPTRRSPEPMLFDL